MVDSIANTAPLLQRQNGSLAKETLSQPGSQIMKAKFFGLLEDVKHREHRSKLIQSWLIILAFFCFGMLICHVINHITCYCIHYLHLHYKIGEFGEDYNIMMSVTHLIRDFSYIKNSGSSFHSSQDVVNQALDGDTIPFKPCWESVVKMCWIHKLWC